MKFQRICSNPVWPIEYHTGHRSSHQKKEKKSSWQYELTKIWQTLTAVWPYQNTTRSRWIIPPHSNSGGTKIHCAIKLLTAAAYQLHIGRCWLISVILHAATCLSFIPLLLLLKESRWRKKTFRKYWHKIPENLPLKSTMSLNKNGMLCTEAAGQL